LFELSGPLTLMALSAVLFGPLCSWYAGRRGRGQVVWLAFGALLGPIALALLGIAPPGRCPACDEPVSGWPATCAICDEPLRQPASADETAEAADHRAVAPFDARVVAPVFRATSPEPDRSAGAFCRGAPEPIPLPVGRAPRPRRPDGDDLPIGVRAGATVVRPDELSGTDEILATGVYVTGSSGLVVGSRYAIARRGASLRILGPLDLDPTTLAIERRLGLLTVTAIGVRLVISETEGRLAMAFGGLAGASGPQLEVALASARDLTDDARPMSR